MHKCSDFGLQLVNISLPCDSLVSKYSNCSDPSIILLLSRQNNANSKHSTKAFSIWEIVVHRRFEAPWKRRPSDEWRGTKEGWSWVRCFPAHICGCGRQRNDLPYMIGLVLNRVTDCYVRVHQRMLKTEVQCVVSCISDGGAYNQIRWSYNTTSLLVTVVCQLFKHDNELSHGSISWLS